MTASVRERVPKVQGRRSQFKMLSLSLIPADFCGSAEVPSLRSAKCVGYVDARQAIERHFIVDNGEVNRP
jgi:hypothetical protein